MPGEEEGDLGSEKVVRVDFRRKRRPTRGGFGGRPAVLLGIFGAVLGVELLGAAALHPRMIGSSFFAPTAIAVAVVCTLAARRVIARVQVAQLHRRIVGEELARERNDGSRDRTLH